MKRLQRFKRITLGLGMAYAFTATPVMADDREIASNLFDAGAEAYDAGQYLVAAEAFLKAHTLMKSPALQFSAAQAYRRQYLVDGSADSLRRAVRLYREYIREDASGQRREEAVNALADLVPLEARLRRKNVATIAPVSPTPAGTPPAPGTTPGNPSAGKPAPVPIPVPGSTPPPQPTPAPDPLLEETEEAEPEAPRKTRLLISAKPTRAEVSIDGGAFVAVPAVVEVKPGAHKVHAQAAGYFEEDFEIEAVEKELVARHIVLRAKPGRLKVDSQHGVSLSLDGQVRAVLPLERPLEVEPGEHFLTLTLPGRVPFSQTILIERDKDTILRNHLDPTKQRKGAWATLIVGMMGASATGILGLSTWIQDSNASRLDAQRQAGTMSSADITKYNQYLESRNTLATATAITGGASAVVLLTSIGLFLTDNPPTIPVPQKKTDSTVPSPRVDLSVGFMSAGLRVEF